MDLQDEEEQQQVQAKLQQMEGAVHERGAQASIYSCIHTLKPSSHHSYNAVTATKYALFCSEFWQHQTQIGLQCALPLTIMLVPHLLSSRLGCDTNGDPPHVLG